MKSVLIVVALIGAAAAVPTLPTLPTLPTRTQRIVGGEPTTIEQYKFMAGMLYLFGVTEHHSCGGALLTSSTVLSAAHCYFGDHPFSWRVRLGSTFHAYGGTVYDVSELINHAEYNPFTVDNDIAIVRLASPATLAGNVDVAQIAGDRYILPDNTPVYAVGWGLLSMGGESPDELRHVQVLTINRAVCTERYSAVIPITPGMTCAGVVGGGMDTCSKDSGGPLVHNGNVVYGVTSAGTCGGAILPGVYAFVPHYADWIVAVGST